MRVRQATIGAREVLLLPMIFTSMMLSIKKPIHEKRLITKQGDLLATH